MPLLENETLTKGYYNTIKDKYPDVSFNQVEAIIKHVFKFIKIQVERPDMPTVLIKYFGKFIIFPGKLKTLLKENDVKLKFNNITAEQHQAKKDKILERLKEIEQDEELIEELEESVEGGEAL